MELYIKYDKLDNWNNIIDDYDFLYKMIELIDFLESHNKNYTKEQYYKILDLQELIKTLGIKEK